MKHKYSNSAYITQPGFLLILFILLFGMVPEVYPVDFTLAAAVQQGYKVTGKVTSASDNTGLPGVTIRIRGSQQGTITNSVGDYSIEVPDLNQTLVFSFVGFRTEEVPLDNRSAVNVVLFESVEALDEVVVTALGITRKEKSLGYSVGKVDGEELVRVVQENAINALAGKVAGVQISSTGGTGSSVSMVIRGANSLSNDNQPLFVIDGVPVVNTLNNVSGFGSDNRVDYGNAISDLNSDDIENISVLKGPSAAALYGSRAGNGVVLITTKSGKRARGVEVTVSSNTVFDRPYKYFAIQKQFANGIFSFTPDDFPPGYVLRINRPIYWDAELNSISILPFSEQPRDITGASSPSCVTPHNGYRADRDYHHQWGCRIEQFGALQLQDWGDQYDQPGYRPQLRPFPE